MGKRLTVKAWEYFKEQYPEDIEGLSCFDVSFDRLNIFPSYTRRGKLKKAKNTPKSNIERYGVELGPILDWLDDNTNEQYYANINRDKEGYRIIYIRFYFFEETDAVAFKLMFGEKT